ncbi:hypothetical protein AAY473_001235 [Plecturocebus cupreus]
MSPKWHRNFIRSFTQAIVTDACHASDIVLESGHSHICKIKRLAPSPRLRHSGVISAHCSLHLLGSSAPPASAPEWVGLQGAPSHQANMCISCRDGSLPLLSRLVSNSGLKQSPASASSQVVRLQLLSCHCGGFPSGSQSCLTFRAREKKRLGLTCRTASESLTPWPLGGTAPRLRSKRMELGTVKLAIGRNRSHPSQ